MQDNGEMINVLVHIVDDEIDTGEEIAALLKYNGVNDCVLYTDPVEFMKVEEQVHLCILDYRFTNSGITGLEMTEQILLKNPRCRVIIITVAPDFKKFMKVYNAGAWKYLDKMDTYFAGDLVKYVRLAIDLTREEMELLTFLTNRKREKGNI